MMGSMGVLSIGPVLSVGLSVRYDREIIWGKFQGWDFQLFVFRVGRAKCDYLGSAGLRAKGVFYQGCELKEDFSKNVVNRFEIRK